MDNFPQNKIKWNMQGLTRCLKMTNMAILHSSLTPLLNTTNFEFFTTIELIQSAIEQTSHWNGLNRWL
jgi:ABC-type antimicrobial peptide transport system permease subunit